MTISTTPHPRLTPVSPAQHRREDMERGSSSAVTLSEIPFVQMLSIRAVPGGKLASIVEATVGPLPATVGEVTTNETASIVWLSPDEFLAILRDDALDAAATLVDQITTQAGAVPGQVIDVSANRTTLELSGPAARDILESSAIVDLHPRAFPVGTAVSTNFAQTQVVIHRTAEETWRLLPRSSFADYVVTWLLDAMEEYRDS